MQLVDKSADLARGVGESRRLPQTPRFNPRDGPRPWDSPADQVREVAQRSREAARCVSDDHQAENIDAGHQTRRPLRCGRLSGPQALRIERLRFVDDEPTAFIRTWLPCDLSELIPAASLEDASLHEQLYARAGLIVSARNRQVRATAARSPIDGLLGIASGSPLLLLEGQSQDQYGRIIEVFSTWHRSDKIAFDLSANNPPQIAAETPVANDGGDNIGRSLNRVQAAAELALAEVARLRGVLGKGDIQ